jgi:hypothetical protein
LKIKVESSIKMCEFCNNNPVSAAKRRIMYDPDFAGFFSSDAIDAAIRQASSGRNACSCQQQQAQQQSTSTSVDDDGT